MMHRLMAGFVTTAESDLLLGEVRKTILELYLMGQLVA